MENDFVSVPKTAGQWVNKCTFWLMGLVDGEVKSKEDALAILEQSITALQEAYKCVRES